MDETTDRKQGKRKAVTASDSPAGNPGHGRAASPNARSERLAKALRANLRRRKNGAGRRAPGEALDKTGG